MAQKMIGSLPVKTVYLRRSKGYYLKIDTLQHVKVKQEHVKPGILGGGDRWVSDERPERFRPDEYVEVVEQ